MMNRKQVIEHLLAMAKEFDLIHSVGDGTDDFFICSPMFNSSTQTDLVVRVEMSSFSVYSKLRPPLSNIPNKIVTCRDVNEKIDHFNPEEVSNLICSLLDKLNQFEQSSAINSIKSASDTLKSLI